MCPSARPARVRDERTRCDGHPQRNWLWGYSLSSPQTLGLGGSGPDCIAFSGTLRCKLRRDCGRQELLGAFGVMPQSRARTPAARPRCPSSRQRLGCACGRGSPRKVRVPGVSQREHEMRVGGLTCDRLRLPVESLQPERRSAETVRLARQMPPLAAPYRTSRAMSHKAEDAESNQLRPRTSVIYLRDRYDP